MQYDNQIIHAHRITVFVKVILNEMHLLNRRILDIIIVLLNELIKLDYVLDLELTWNLGNSIDETILNIFNIVFKESGQ